MIGYELPPELKLLREVVREFMEREVLPRERSLGYDEPYLPDAELAVLQAKAREIGLWCLGTPKEYGGAGLSLFAQVVVAEQASKHRNGAYNPALGAFGKDPPNVVVRHGTPEQIERYVIPTVRSGRHTFVAITEPSGGSDPARSIRMRAQRRGDVYVLNGRKVFISEVDKSDWGIVFARTSDDPGRRGISCFIVELNTPGLTWRYVPVIRAWWPAELVFEDVEVPVRNRVGEEGQGFELANEWLVTSRIPYAAGCIGIAAAALEMAIEHARQRETFGSLLATRQAVQWSIADSEVEIRAARWLVWESAWKADRGEECRLESSIAKLYATEVANRVVDRCVQIFGGYGVSKEYPLERWYRELRIKRIGEGPSEVHRMVIARELLGRAALGR